MAVGYGRSHGVTIFPMTRNARKFVLSGIRQQPKDAMPKFELEDVGEVIVTRFAQTEPLVKLEGKLNGYDVFFFFSYEGRIDERVIELGLAIQTAKKRGADRITVFFPYMPYSRGDKRDQHHVSATLKHFIDSCLNLYGVTVITGDLHNPATIDFVEGPSHMLSLRNVMSDEIRKNEVAVTVAVAPDSGSVKRTRKWADALYLEDDVCLERVVVDKMRTGNDDTAMAEMCFGADVKGKNVLIIDDEAMTLGTLMSAVKVLKAAGALEIRVVVYHGILVGPAIKRLAESQISEMIVSNTVPIPRSKINGANGKLRVVHVEGFFIEAARRWYACESLSSMIDYAYES